MEKIWMFLLWAFAIAAVAFAFRNAGEPRWKWSFGNLPSGVGILGAALFMLLLTGCFQRAPIQAASSGCSQLIPETWKLGVAGAEIPPEVAVVADWISFADAQTGKLDQANGRTADAIGIVERCEARDAEAIRRASRGFFGRLFGS